MEEVLWLMKKKKMQLPLDFWGEDVNFPDECLNVVPGVCVR